MLNFINQIISNYIESLIKAHLSIYNLTINNGNSCSYLSYFQGTISLKEVIVSGKVKLNCKFILSFTTYLVDKKKSKVSCSPKKSLTVKGFEITGNDCSFKLDVSVKRGKGKIIQGIVLCLKPTITTTSTTTTATTPFFIHGNCGPAACGLLCNANEFCEEDIEISCHRVPGCPRWKCSGNIKILFMV